VPITAATGISYSTNLEKELIDECEELVRSYEKAIMLNTIDEAWKEHLREWMTLDNRFKRLPMNRKILC